VQKLQPLDEETFSTLAVLALYEFARRNNTVVGSACDYSWTLGIHQSTSCQGSG